MPPAAPLGPAETSQQQVEEAFKDFTTREDIAVLLINQAGAGVVRGARRGQRGLV